MAADKSGEFRGRSLEAAINSGLAALGVAREQVDVEVVRPGSRGLLGIGAEDAVVRLTVISGQPPRAETARTESARSEPRAPEAAAAGAESAPVRTETPRPPRGASRSRTAPRPEPRPEPPASEDEDEDEAGPEIGAHGGDSVEQGRAVLERLLEYMNLRARVEIITQSEAEAAAGERATVLNIVGEDLSLLIGRQSEVLSALQFLTRLMVNQQSRGRANLVVDVNGYKAKRAESLRKLALRTAEQVMQTGRTMALEPMPPAERRIIHLALRNHPSVTSQSVGEGTKRKVTVVPKKA